jgi:lipopolysaccharide transport system ATP-binding protein
VSHVVIRASDLRKVYRLYSKPSYRFRDMFGLLGAKAGAYTEHAALDGINLEIRRGEKVAIIGRNGAGKSTFLKLATRVIEPTSGSLHVEGRVQALLQIGTGFHPEFTGRENVRAYFAQLGITGAEADEKCAAAVEFAELEEYVDQPVKTYSTGMAVRLMFSASTVITPELLVLDEVLGVGDAYFAHKSYARIRELSDDHGTTVLLVTHDIYSAVRLCSRVVWIDRGRIVFDGDGATGVKAYEDSVRQQEEARLRSRNLERVRRAMAMQGNAGDHVLIEVHGAGNVPQPAAVYFSRIELAGDHGQSAVLPLGPDAFRQDGASHLQGDGTAWGEPTLWHGRHARAFLNYGSPFHKVAGVFIPAPATVAGQAPRALLDYWSDASCDLIVRSFLNGRELDPVPFRTSAGGWSRAEVVLRAAATSTNPAPGTNTSGVHGTGQVLVSSAAFHDASGRDTTLLEHGCPASFSIGYRIVDPAIGRVQLVVAWQRDGIQDVCRFMASELDLVSREGTIRLDIEPLAITDGRYAITILIAEPGYYDREQTAFYTINPGVYCCLSRLLEVDVAGAGLVGAGTAAVVEGRWSVTS